MNLRRSSIVLFFGLLLSSLQLSAQFDIPPLPEKQTSLYDYVDLLEAQDANRLEEKLLRYADTTSTQIVVAIIATAKGENIGLLTPRWAQEWGIGQSDTDNGVFILLARDDRRRGRRIGQGTELARARPGADAPGVGGSYTPEVGCPGRN